jgi:hypothetical protein
MHPREPELKPALGEPSCAGADPRLAAALRRLPEIEPPADGWERLARRLGTRRRRGVWAPTVATAACALLVAVALLVRPEMAAPRLDGAGVARVREPAAPAPPASDWRARSVELERLLVDVPEPRLARASTALTTTLLEDRIALIDEQLTDVADGVSSADTESLYRERVLLLDSLVRVRYAAAVDPAT